MGVKNSVGGQIRTERWRFYGDRAKVRAATVEHALRLHHVAATPVNCTSGLRGAAGTGAAG